MPSFIDAMLVNQQTGHQVYVDTAQCYSQQPSGSTIAAKIFCDTAKLLRENDLRRTPQTVDVIMHGFQAQSGGEGQAILGVTSDFYELEGLRQALTTRLSGSRNKAVVIFMRGYQLAECLTCIAASCKIDLLFFLRHLEYLWWKRSPELFASPCMPSASHRTVRLKIATLGGIRTSISGIRDLRSKCESSMEHYRMEAIGGNVLKPGNEIVRAFNVHDASRFSTEQEMMVIIEPQGDSWSVVVWTDVSKYSRSQPRGPWCVGKRFGNHRTPAFHTFEEEEMETMLEHRDWAPRYLGEGYAQSTRSLATNYGRTLDPSLAAIDSFYSLTELFQTSADSLDRLLNEMKTVIDRNTGYSNFKAGDYSPENLSYNQEILKRLEARLRENVSDLESHQNVKWPRSYSLDDDSAAQSKAKASATAELLIADFKNLLARTEHLLAQCQSGISVCMSTAAIAESQQAILQAKQVRRLTALAFLYIPLSFTTSFFGMNLKIFGSGSLRMWTWIAVSGPLLLVTYAALALSDPGFRQSARYLLEHGLRLLLEIYQDLWDLLQKFQRYGRNRLNQIR
ncbi:hypothetical protein ACLMJK_007751 [Lecanora helva]